MVLIRCPEYNVPSIKSATEFEEFKNPGPAIWTISDWSSQKSKEPKEPKELRQVKTAKTDIHVPHQHYLFYTIKAYTFIL